MMSSYTVNTIPLLSYKKERKPASVVGNARGERKPSSWKYSQREKIEAKRVQLNTSRVSLDVVPAQNRRIPSSVEIQYAQWKELLYCTRASKACMQVLKITENRIDRTRMRETNAYSRGVVMCTTINPAIMLIPDIIAIGGGWPGRASPCTNCLRVVNWRVEFAPRRII